MTTTLGIRDLSRGMSALEGYDYANIEDKKTKQTKGLIVSNEYAEVVKKYIDKLAAKKRQQEIDEIMQFAGSIKIKEEYLHTTTNTELGEARVQRFLEKEKQISQK